VTAAKKLFAICSCLNEWHYVGPVSLDNGAVGLKTAFASKACAIWLQAFVTRLSDYAGSQLPNRLWPEDLVIMGIREHFVFRIMSCGQGEYELCKYCPGHKVCLQGSYSAEI